jgi:hypothetical protein
MIPMLALDAAGATVVAAVIGAVGGIAAAGISAVGLHRTRRVERTANEARAEATSAAASVRPNGRGTVMQLLEQVDDKVAGLAEQKAIEHRQLHERVTAVVTLIAHYLGPPPPGLSIPPPLPEQQQQQRRRHQPSSEET